MRSGIKNAVVAIWTDGRTRDPNYNTTIYTPVLWKDGVFCDATPRRGREVEVDGQIRAETYMKFDFEYFDVEGIESSMWIVHEGVRYEIKAILPDIERKDWISVDTVAAPLTSAGS